MGEILSRTTIIALVEQIGALVDLTGVAIIVIAILYATFLFVFGKVGDIGRYKQYRQTLGKGILLGLEILVAGDIIRTVGLAPTLQNVLVLAIIVAIRTCLSWTLEVELQGRWPWQKAS